MRIVIETSSAVVVAALLKDKRFKGKKVCAIITGGNIDLRILYDKVKSRIIWIKYIDKSLFSL